MAAIDVPSIRLGAGLKQSPRVLEDAIHDDPFHLIPADMSSALRFKPAQDTRSSQDILASLSVPQPITTEKNVWTFWHSGLLNMPAWCKRNIVNWSRLLGSSWTIHVTDLVDGSPLNVKNYISSDYLPAAITKVPNVSSKHSSPWYANASDVLRTALLHAHGGVWLDVGNLLFLHLDALCWDVLEDPNTPFDIAVPHGGALSMFNYMIASRKDSPFILAAHKVYLALWEGAASPKGFGAHALLQPVYDMQAAVRASGYVSTMDTYDEPFAASLDEIRDYIANMTAWERVCMTECDPSEGFSGVHHWQEKVFLFEGWSETSIYSRHIGWNGRALADLFEIPLTELDLPGREKQREAVWDMLAHSSFLKIYRGPLLKRLSCGKIWDAAVDDVPDARPGTVGELIRYASVHFEQTRTIDRVEAPAPLHTIKKGLLEV